MNVRPVLVLVAVACAALSGCGVKAAPRPPIAPGSEPEAPTWFDDDAGCCGVLR